MNYGHRVRDLLLELKRSDDTGTAMDPAAIPAYNDILVRQALQDFSLHVQALQEQVEAAALANGDTSSKPSLSVRPSILLQNAACQRNKRGLLAYHWIRLQRIQELFYWQSHHHHQDESISHQSSRIDDEDSATASSKMVKQLCPAEVDFLSHYHAILSKYTETLGMPEISDLRAHCTLPPITIDRVLCRVVNATPFGDGNIVLESGQCVNFILGSTHHLIYSDCEEYIRLGALQLLHTEET